MIINNKRKHNIKISNVVVGNQYKSFTFYPSNDERNKINHLELNSLKENSVANKFFEQKILTIDKKVVNNDGKDESKLKPKDKG